MILSNTLGMQSASDPMAGAAAPKQSIGSAILAGLQASQGSDPGASAMLGTVFSQASEASRLLASVQPNLGRNVNMTA